MTLMFKWQSWDVNSRFGVPTDKASSIHTRGQGTNVLFPAFRKANNMMK